MRKVREMFNDNMSRLWSQGRGCGGRGGMAGGFSGLGGADGGADRAVLGN